MMCLGLPMQVARCHGLVADCRQGERWQSVDLSLVGEVQPGDWLLVFTGAAREVLSPQQAADILDALAALDAAMNGRFDPAIHLADLNQREPQLPPHLQAQFDAQRKPS
ncbi:HypC/HybG/HupF family hydrogenase formation chaperone [Aquitalea aquatica]|nr:HypC/HybG/HupF family hydrogenase formation chaperone [Aquitalea magnusonii]